MLDPNVIKSRAAVAAYKELNKNTVEKLVKGAGNSKTWYFEKVQIDENAAKFQSDQKKAIAEAEKLKKAAKRSKTPSKAKKEKEIKEKIPGPGRVYEKTGISELRLNRRKTMYELSLQGVKHEEIAAIVGLGSRTVTYELSAYRKDHGLGIHCATRNKVFELVKKGLTVPEISDTLKKSRSNIAKHISILRQDHPDLVVNRKRKSAKEKGLSPENIAVMELVDQGLRRCEIAEKLNISPNTITHHLQMIKRKAGKEWIKKIQALDTRLLTKNQKKLLK